MIRRAHGQRAFLGHRVLRSPARPLDPVLHRDVGALQLLRHARPPAALRDRTGGGRWPRPVGLGGRGDLRPVHLDGVHGGAAGRMDRRSTARPAAGGAVGRHHHRRRSLHGRHPDPGDLLSRAHAHRRRHRAVEGQRLGDRRTALWRRGSAARRRLLDLLHGHQSRRVPGAAGVRLPRAARQLAHRIRGRRGRDDARRPAIRRDVTAPARRRRPPSGDVVGGGVGGVVAAGTAVGRAGPARPDRARRRRRHRHAADHGGRRRRRRRRAAPAQHRGVLRLALLRRRLDAGGAAPALRDWRAVLRLGAVLVGVRAGRVDPQSLRRSQHPHRGLRPVVSQQLVPERQLVLHLHAGAGVRVVLALAGAARPGADQPSKFVFGAGVASASAS